MTRLRLLAAALATPLVLWLFVPVLSDGQSIGTKIERKQSQIQEKKDQEGVLTSTIQGYSQRIGALQGDIDTLTTRQVRVETDLAAKREELQKLQDELRRERIRLTQLRARLAEARAVLSDRLVALYKADKPDVVTVILESDGFADLLERAEFMERVSDQDGRIINDVRDAKEESVAAEKRLKGLEARQSEVTAIVAKRAAEIREIKDGLVSRQNGLQEVRADKHQTLVSVRSDRHELETNLASLEKEQAKIAARLAGVNVQPAGSVRHGSGRFIWPVNGTFTSPFGYRWGRLHAGIDIAVPEGTPIRAADGGTVAIAGWTGGYGNYTCVNHGGGVSTCYGHQSRIAVSVGQSVSQGQVIGYSGNTGNSTGPHLHFEVRIGGNPVDPMGYL
ncbi:MAG: murein hydrolase activator EnvC [Solirubrobacteraceae bacterium]